jgi:hypothetical protein
MELAKEDGFDCTFITLPSLVGPLLLCRVWLNLCYFAEFDFTFVTLPSLIAPLLLCRV